MEDTRLKTILITTGVVKRTAKELIMYRKEVDALRQRIKELVDEGEDEYNTSQVQERLAESKTAALVCHGKFTRAFCKLEGLIEEEFPSQEKEYIAAKMILEETRALIPWPVGPY